MKFKLLSDLHLEFDRGNPWIPPNPDKNVVLLLAGDIHLGVKGADWIKDRCEEYKHVVYILGNHEYYKHEYWEVKSAWHGLAKTMPGNFHFLDEGSAVMLDNIAVIGGTLWTLIHEDDEKAKNYGWYAGTRMNDYRIAKFYDGERERRLEPMDTRDEHILTIKNFEYMIGQLQQNRKILVMTHHLPSESCVDRHFKGDMMNPFYMTDLEWMMEKYNIDVWVHGHTHVNVDTEIHGTRIICNPRGYAGYELNPEFKEDLIFEL